jgi:hypothetical protein
MAGLWPAGWAPSGPSGAATAQAAPLILTLALPDALQRQADAMRAAVWPQAARRAPAHCTLFRHLPGLHQDDLVRLLRRVRPATQRDFDVAAPVRWGDRWVAPINAPALDQLRADLADSLHGLLAPGDLAPPRLHISLSEGRNAPPALPTGPWPARGLLLWRHAASRAERGGPCWTPLVALAFHG